MTSRNITTVSDDDDDSDEYVVLDTKKEDNKNLFEILAEVQLEEFIYVTDRNDSRETINSTESKFSMERIGSDINLFHTTSQQIGPQVLNDPEVVAKTRPIELKWTYGVNANAGIINLTVGDRKEIFFASAHFPVLYNYCTKQMKCLEGHQYKVTCLSADNSGQWLVTADNHVDGCVIIWDSIEYKPVFTLFNIYPVSGVLLLRLSGSARYLITIGWDSEGDYTVDFWLWTLGGDQPNDSFKVDRNHEEPVAICFNPDIEEHIMIVFQNQVFLLIWDAEKRKFSNPVVPTITHKNKIGLLTGGTYLDSCHECYASSSKGSILIFGNTLYARPYEEGELDNAKIFRNAIKVTPASIGCCTTVDGLLVTGDTRGFIFFFDKRVRLLYWLRNYSLGSITSISFHLVPKLKYEKPGAVYIPRRHEDSIFECDFKDIVEELEMIMNKDVPTDASLKKALFIVKDFFIATTHFNIYAIDCLNDKCTPIFFVADDYVSAIETHVGFNYVIFSYANGRLMLVDYEKNDLVCEALLPKTDEDNTITCLKYSDESIHLVCGTKNGEIWILEPILLTPKMNPPFKPTNDKVVKIRFSLNSTQFAYYDTNRTVVIFLYNWETGIWQLRGKIRPHYDDIHDIMFVPSGDTSVLYTISKDRYMVEYNNNKIRYEAFGVASSQRIEQTAIPMNFIYWLDCNGDRNNGYFVIADNKHKIKFLYQETKIPKSIVLAPAFGCFKNQLIQKMKIIPNTNTRYMAFLTEKHIGIQIFPPDGNPYKYVGYLAHPIGKNYQARSFVSKDNDFTMLPPYYIVDFVSSSDGKYIFTFGVNAHCIFKWQIIPRAVELMNVLGGKELEPFYCLIEGGKNGWLFQEIKDLFYYTQILQQDTVDLPRRVSDSIKLSELPDLVRTCGFYPTEFEMENMMLDYKYRNYYESGNINEEINFIDFVKLFCNHKPAYGYSKEELEEAFSVLAKSVEESSGDTIKREEFVKMLTTRGEPINVSSVHKYLKTLMRVHTTDEYIDFLPEEISFNALSEEILGIDMTRTQILECENKEDAGDTRNVKNEKN